MGQKDGKKWTAAVDLQPTIPKSDRLLGVISPHGKLFTKDEADDLFLELMTREKVSFFKRNFAYAAVKLAGRSAWKVA